VSAAKSFARFGREETVSRIGKMPIAIPQEVSVKTHGNTVEISGPLGSLRRELPTGIKVRIDEQTIHVERSSESKTARSLHGLTRALLNNMVIGVAKGFQKTLDIEGVGYRAKAENASVVFDLGYSHPILLIPPEGVSVTVNSPTEVVVSGFDKELVGLVSAKIRSFRPPAVYTGKGVRYRGEYVRRKAGKGGAKA
jgi:large subunit ribosomal protein L6